MTLSLVSIKKSFHLRVFKFGFKTIKRNHHGGLALRVSSKTVYAIKSSSKEGNNTKRYYADLVPHKRSYYIAGNCTHGQIKVFFVVLFFVFFCKPDGTLYIYISHVVLWTLSRIVAVIIIIVFINYFRHTQSMKRCGPKKRSMIFSVYWEQCRRKGAY